MNPIEAAAWEYLLREWQPVPLHPKEKIPIGNGWQEHTVTPNEVAELFSADRNIGIRMGVPSGIVDIDLDHPGARALADVFLPETKCKFGRESSRESHRLYRPDQMPKTMQYRTAAGKMLVEIRSTGAQTMAPPSTHPCGEKVTWDLDGEPAKVTRDELIRCAGEVAAGALLMDTYPDKGGRHDFALALSGTLLAGGRTGEFTALFVEALATVANDDEVGDRVKSVTTTAEKVAAGEPVTSYSALAGLLGHANAARLRTWLGLTGNGPSPAPAASSEWAAPIALDDVPVPPFPTKTLPNVVREFVEAEAEATQTPPALAGSISLATGAAAVARKVEVEVKPGYREPLNLFVAGVLPPAERKSAVIRDSATAIFEEYERFENRARMIKAAKADTEVKLLEVELQKLELAIKKEEDVGAKEALKEQIQRLHVEYAMIHRPRPLVLFTDDATPEALASLLAKHDERMAVFSAEGGIFSMMAGRYSGMPNLEVYLKGHAGDALRVDRKSREPEYLHRPALTVGLTVQPEIIRGLGSQPGFRGRGLLGRFLYSMPTSRLGYRKTDGVPPVADSVRTAYRKVIWKLLALPFAMDADGDDGYSVHVMKFSSEAAPLMNAFEAELEPKLAESGDLGHISDWAGKLFGATGRIAAILHLMENADSAKPWELSISANTTENAILLARYFVPHALKAFAEMGADPIVQLARAALAWILRHNATVFSRRDLQQGLKTSSGRRKPEDIDRAIQLLIEHEYIRQRSTPFVVGPGRRPSATFDANPALFEKKKSEG